MEFEIYKQRVCRLPSNAKCIYCNESITINDNYIFSKKKRSKEKVFMHEECYRKLLCKGE